MEPPSPLNGPACVASLPGYRIACDLYYGTPKWLDTEAIDPCKRKASTPVGGSKRADFQRVGQASLRGNMTLRRHMAHSPQGG